MSRKLPHGWILLLAAVSFVQSAAADCSIPADPANGEIIRNQGNSFRSGDTLRFTCNGPHFRPIPISGSVTCDGDQWQQNMRCALVISNALFDVPETKDATNTLVDIGLPMSHHIGIELYFIFDASSGVGRDNFERSKKVAKELVKEIGVTNEANSLRVGAIKFNSDAHVMFHTVECNTTRDVVSAINAIDYGDGGGTNIAIAFDRILNVMLPRSRLLRRPGSFKTVFLLADGNPNEGGDSRENARLLREEGVTIHCIGTSEDANRRYLLDYASEPADEHVFFMKDYTTLETLIKAVTNQTVDYSECGKSSRPLHREAITQKTPAREGSWPWQVLLLIANGGKEFVCGGTLIKENWILSAANCLQELDSIEVYVGLVERSERHRFESQAVKRIIIHPDYDVVTKRYDIALIELERNVTLGPNVRKACLPDPAREERLLHRGSAIVTGWGHIGVVQKEDNQESLAPEDDLHQLTLGLRDREECEESLIGEAEEHWFDETMTCAGYLNKNVGPCRGDSGGPLIKYAKGDNGRQWTVIGVTSWGVGCALENELDFFTNVPRLMPWINENINM